MAAGVVLITGGSRSGKSSHALALALDRSRTGPRYFIATCPVLDAETAERIRKHKEAREGAEWITLEETTDLAGAVSRARDAEVIVIDCLTLWVNNLLYEDRDQTLTEEAVSEKCLEVVKRCREIPAAVYIVTNEVGMGIVPDNALSRRFRDLAGRCNQQTALAADSVILMVSGIPLKVK